MVKEEIKGKIVLYLMVGTFIILGFISGIFLQRFRAHLVYWLTVTYLNGFCGYVLRINDPLLNDFTWWEDVFIWIFVFDTLIFIGWYIGIFISYI